MAAKKAAAKHKTAEKVDPLDPADNPALGEEPNNAEPRGDVTPTPGDTWANKALDEPPNNGAPQPTDEPEPGDPLANPALLEPPNVPEEDAMSSKAGRQARRAADLTVGDRVRTGPNTMADPAKFNVTAVCVREAAVEVTVDGAGAGVHDGYIRTEAGDERFNSGPSDYKLDVRWGGDRFVRTIPFLFARGIFGSADGAIDMRFDVQGLPEDPGVTPAGYETVIVDGYDRAEQDGRSPQDGAAVTDDVPVAENPGAIGNPNAAGNTAVNETGGNQPAGEGSTNADGDS